ncbi:helix-turn-helix transcriptional regulator [Rhizobium ruizarguesonis]|uniref:helix-turn-helix transcriptional regulator n=1 Tax=Rhizobium TaxID=379 RepID=UPI0015CF400C|nr:MULTISPECIES: helix-turn-helix domain-containing protein [Rhizobium]MBB4327836.1 putative DNA-binding transcriptional regulator AlpA [Rhizobium leguminosarum]MBB4353501.1 putative DNA-binding transcriptional regulator AlpA [Rhizobium leguminosarum]MBB4548450.1 putative DNA-binding transcriptional regulator AlpA [Rhizobium leguminosarum]MBB4561465.1 putative DNA-binding transcriptional regulator AlpA [Rhizobium leguminosarum]
MLDTTSTQRRMLRTEDAANYTGLSASTLTKLRLTGGGPEYIKIGKSVVYDPSDLETWLTSKRRRSTSVAA